MNGAKPDRFADITLREQGLRRTLSARQLAMIAIGGAIGTGLFLGSSFAISLAGPAVLFSYLIGALVTLLLMGCLAEMTVAHPSAGSFGGWAEHYLSPLAGFLVRVSYWAGNVFALGTEVSAIAVYMRFWFPAVPGWIWICAFAAALVTVNGFHVKFFGCVEYGLSLLKVSAIVIFIFLAGWLLIAASKAHISGASGPIGFQNYTNFGGFFPKGVSGMWCAVLVSLFSYFSIEMIAVAAGEAKDPSRAIRHAFRATMLRLGVFYLCTLALVLALAPWPTTASGATQSPFVTVVANSGLAHAAGVVNFVILIAALSAMNSQMYITSRMLFSLSRSGYAPRSFAALSKSGVPVAALCASTAGIALAALLNAFEHDRAFLIMLAVSLFGPLFTWFMIFVTHLSFRRNHARDALLFRMWGYPYTSLVGATLMLAALVTTIYVPAFQPTLLYGLPFLALMTIVYTFQTRKLTRVSGATAKRS